MKDLFAAEKHVVGFVVQLANFVCDWINYTTPLFKGIVSSVGVFWMKCR